MNPRKFEPRQLDVPRDLLDVFLLVKTDRDESQYDFSVVLEEWEQQGFTFKLVFENPMRISMGAEQDEVVLRFKDPKILIPLESTPGLSIDDDYIRIKLLRQLDTTQEEDSVQLRAIIAHGFFTAIVLLVLIVLVLLRSDLNLLVDMMLTT